jgi:hypothetical protein
MSQSSLKNNFFWYICTPSGFVAERLGNGLQNRVQRFESARNLNTTAWCVALGFFDFTAIKQRLNGRENQQSPLDFRRKARLLG